MKLFWKIYTTTFIFFIVVFSLVTYPLIIKQVFDTERHIVEENRIFGSFMSKEIEVGYLKSSWPFESLGKLSENKSFLFWWVVRDDGTIHLANDASFMGTQAYDYFPQMANIIGDENVFLDRKQNYGIFTKSLETGKEKCLFWLGFSLKEISEVRKEITLPAIVGSMSVMVILGVILYFAIVHFTKPINDLATGAAIIGKGDLTHRVKIESEDELSQLADSFNKMAQDLQETTVSKDYVNNIIGSMTDSLIVVDPDGKIRTVNKATCELLEYKEEELIGSPVELIFGTAEEVPLKGVKLEKLIEEGELRNYETRYKTKDGQEIPILFSGSVMKDKYGNVIRIVCIGRDITERKRAEEALQHRLEMERLVATMSANFINLAPDEIDSEISQALRTTGEFAGVDRSYIFLFSDDGKKVADTLEWRTGVTEPIIDDLKGLSIEAFPWAMQRLNPPGIIHIPSVADLPPEASGEKEMLQAYDTQSFVGVPMVYGGSLVGFLGFDSIRTEKTWMEEDISLLKMVGEIFVNALARKRAEEALKHRLEVEERIARELEEKAKELSRANEELDAFVYNVSHDLKAPVVSLQGFSSLLVKDCEDHLDENGKMYIDRIQKNSERMGTLIDDLLELSRVGRVKGQEEMVNISDIISDAVDQLASQLEERGTRLMVKGEMPAVKCDRTRIGQVFVNLISNANKFMGEDNEDPTIEVGYDEEHGGYTFYVRDNGIGIDKEHHEIIFRIFQRLNDIETEGTGVGLAIVKKIVENFGGKIWVDSTKGKGTTMYFTMPKG